MLGLIHSSYANARLNTAGWRDVSSRWGKTEVRRPITDERYSLNIHYRFTVCIKHCSPFCLRRATQR